MPEIPPSKKRPPAARPEQGETAPRPIVRYAELHAKTNFSFLEGASHPDELVTRAAELGYQALAVTDRNSLAGVVRAHVAAKEVGLRLIVGAEITPDDAPGLVLWTTDRASYGRLARLITVGRRRAEKGKFQASLDDVAAHSAGLLAGITTEPNKLLARAAVERYREVFGDRCYLLAELYLGTDDERRLDELMELSRQTRVPLVAAGDVHFHARGRLALKDVLSATRLGMSVAEAGEHLFPNAERYLKPLAALATRFARVPEAIERTVEIAERSTFSLSELRYEYPEELAPRGETPLEYLSRLAWAGARKRYPAGVPAKVHGLVEHELELIGRLHYEAYFLTVFDLVRFARRRGILCQGRGSAANSAVCYCLGVTSVDPEQLDVLFERFISAERNEAPDIDIDFEHERREEVLQYLYDKYGRERSGMTAEVITYRPRSAVRDVGKALGLSLDRVDVLAKSLEGHRLEEHFEQRCRDADIDPASFVGGRLVNLVRELVGFPRHLGQHVGGMVMTRGPLCELVPIENAAMQDRTVIEWDKDDLDELGILKVDCLSLGMLTAIRKCFQLIEQHTGRKFNLATVHKEDPRVYDMICRADTMGVFQIESRAQMSMLPRLKPREYYDLVIEVAIVRPGPIQGNMVHPYLRRRAGLEPVTYPNAEIQSVLSKTLGVPLFQEQAMRLAVVAAGFTPGEADQLRRAMGAWRRPGIIEQFRQKLLTGMQAKGLPEEFAANVFRQIRGFGEYGFPESHAASFALLVYVSAWLKHHHLAAFTASLINSQPMGFYAPAQLVRCARDHGVEVRGIDVNESGWDCTLEEAGKIRNSEFGIRNGENRNSELGIRNGERRREKGKGLALRLGMRLISGLSEGHGRAIEAARGAGPFVSLDDFARRTRLSRAVIKRLAAADVFASLEIDRRTALWQALGQEEPTSALPLLAQLADEPEPAAPLPAMPIQRQVVADYQTAGLSLRAHPLQFERQALEELRVVPAVRLPMQRDGGSVRVAGLVLVRQRPATAKGITFVTLEDETGTVNLIIRPDVWQRFYRVARMATLLLAQGRLQRKGQIIHVLVARLEDLSELLGGMSTQSRDFH